MFSTEFEKLAAGRGDMLKKIVAEAQKIIDTEQRRMPHLQPHQRTETARKLEATREKMNRASKLIKKGAAITHFPKGTIDAARKRYNDKVVRGVDKHVGARTSPKGKLIKLIDMTPETLKRILKAKV
jgi:hypothetical protein